MCVDVDFARKGVNRQNEINEREKKVGSQSSLEYLKVVEVGCPAV